MREILFKAKRLDNGEWVEGNLVLTPNADEDFKAIIIPFNDNGEYTEGAEDECLGFETWYKVDTTTICQYTGLTDKNGNKIWENDICDRKEKYPEVVKQYQGDWVLDYSCVLGKEEGNSYCNLGFYCCERNCVEVIGNIFDNPKLIKECD